MKRLSTLIWIVVFAIATLLLYQAKYEVQSLKNQVAATSRQLEEEKQALHVVAAEWAYLNRPERLEQLAGKYLNASDVTADKIADVRSIPFTEKMQASLTVKQEFTPAAVHINK